VATVVRPAEPAAAYAPTYELADEVVDRPLVITWFLAGFVWLLVFPTLGVIASTKIVYPEFLGDISWLTYGRIRPVHVNGVVWAAFSSLAFGIGFYVLPRLTGREVWGGRLLSWAVFWLWQVSTIGGLVAVLAGYNKGLEVADLPRPAAFGQYMAIVATAAAVLMTVIRRREPKVYVALWYLMGTFVWTTLWWPLGQLILPSWLPGVNNAALHGLYLHFTVGLWTTPLGYVSIYYFLPHAVNNPLYSHRLSLVGFWALAYWYPFLGIHHYLYSPIADWAETIAIVSSMFLIIPVWTVLQNFFGTMIGKWHEFGRNLPAKFLIAGSIMYLLGCFQGSLEALRSFQRATHFTDFVISHSHLTVFGTFVLWAIAGAFFAWPRLVGRRLWSFRMGNWAFWLMVAGVAGMGLGLTAAGLMNGFQLIAGTDWVKTVIARYPWWWFRTFSGIAMDVGMSLMIINFMMTALWGDPLPPTARPRRPGEPVSAPPPGGRITVGAAI
jgi:cytochrome c oxidase cbb3-type subunit I